jgi:hypothetical protein
VARCSTLTVHAAPGGAFWAELAVEDVRALELALRAGGGEGARAPPAAPLAPWQVAEALGAAWGVPVEARHRLLARTRSALARRAPCFDAYDRESVGQSPRHIALGVSPALPRAK